MIYVAQLQGKFRKEAKSKWDATMTGVSHLPQLPYDAPHPFVIIYVDKEDVGVMLFWAGDES